MKMLKTTMLIGIVLALGTLTNFQTRTQAWEQMNTQSKIVLGVILLVLFKYSRTPNKSK